MIGGDAVSQRVRAAGIFRDVSADGAGFLARRIGREMQTEHARQRRLKSELTTPGCTTAR